MVDVMKRREFADFLERLAERGRDLDDRGEYVVNHFKDETLEECRHNCARLSIEAGDS